MLILNRKFYNPLLNNGKYSNIVYAKGGSIPLAKDSLAKFKGINNFNYNTLKSNNNNLLKSDNIQNNITDNKSKISSLLPYASNIINGFRRLPNPITPPQETYTTSNLINLDASRNTLDANRRSFNRETDYKVSNPAVAQALKASTFGEYSQELNNLSQEEANQNALIKNQNNQFNQGVQARNIERIRDYNREGVEKNIAQQNLLSDNVANLTDKIQEEQRDKNLMSLEDRKLSYLPEFYDKNQGYYQRFQKRNNNTQLEGYKALGGEIDPKKGIRLLKERQEKRDSVKTILNEKYPKNFNKVNEGMTNYYIKEPSKYRFESGGTIHINPENKGKFNALKVRTGKNTEELTHSKNPLTRKRAIFALNSKKWH